MRVVTSASGSVGTSRSVPARDGGILARDNLVHVRPLAHNGRCGKVRTEARRWNVGSRYGKTGEMFSHSLHDNPFAKHTYYDSECNKLCTL